MSKTEEKIRDRGHDDEQAVRDAAAAAGYKVAGVSPAGPSRDETQESP